MIYLDNSASTLLKPKAVYRAVNYALKNASNPGRSSHSLSIELAEKILNSRINICDTFNCGSIKNVIFTQNCSEALNLAISGLISDGEVITSTMEHNSVLRVLVHHREQGTIKLKFVKPTENNCLSASEFEKAITKNTKMAVITHISNVTGARNPIYEIGEICKKHNIIFVVDSAQGAGIEFLDMEKCNINCLALAGHKNLYGVQGAGVLLLRDVKPKPLKFGGNGVDSINTSYTFSPPDCYEVGTVNTPAILALNEGLQYVKNNQLKLNKKLSLLTKYTFLKLEKINNIKILSCKENCYGVISFNINNFTSSEIANYLNRFKIAVRSGLQCAPLVHKSFKTEKYGAVRVSLSTFNKKSDINKLAQVLKKLQQKNNLN